MSSSSRRAMRALQSAPSPLRLVPSISKKAFFSSTRIARDAPRDEDGNHAESSKAAAEMARARAWYLEDDSTPHTPSEHRRVPRFTTFDPLRTTEAIDDRPMQPFPDAAPPYLRPLYDFLASEEAAEAIVPGSVAFLRTKDPMNARTEDRDLIRGLGEVGARWNWVVVAEARGRSKGVVARADRMLRRWLYDHPVSVSGAAKPYTGRRPKLPKIGEDADWSIVEVLADDTCVNVFTAEGNELYDLTELWTGQPSRSQPQDGVQPV